MIRNAILGVVCAALLGGGAAASTVELFGPLEFYELVLKDAELMKYIHLDVPGRVPVGVCRVLTHPDLGRSDLPYAITLVEPNTAEVSQALCFTTVRSDGEHGMVEFSYPPEGISGRFTFERVAGIWKVKSRRIWEQ